MLLQVVLVLSPYLNNYRRWCTYQKFNLIFRKYVEHLYLQINLLCQSQWRFYESFMGINVLTWRRIDKERGDESFMRVDIVS